MKKQRCVRKVNGATQKPSAKRRRVWGLYKLFVQISLFYNIYERQTEHEQHRKLSESHAAALEQEVSEVEAAFHEEEFYLKSDEQTVEQRGHKRRQNRQLEEPDVAEPIHGQRSEEAGKRAENQVVGSEHGQRADVRDDAADGQSGDSG